MATLGQPAPATEQDADPVLPAAAAEVRAEMPAHSATPSLMGIPAELRQAILSEVAASDTGDPNPLGAIAMTNRALYAEAARFRPDVIEWKAGTTTTPAGFLAASQAIEALDSLDRPKPAAKLMARWPRLPATDQSAVVPMIASTLKSVRVAARHPAADPLGDPFHAAAKALPVLRSVRTIDAGFDVVAPFIVELQLPLQVGRQRAICATITQLSMGRRFTEFNRLLDTVASRNVAFHTFILHHFAEALPKLRTRNQEAAARRLLTMAETQPAHPEEIVSMLEWIKLSDLGLSPASRLGIFNEMIRIGGSLPPEFQRQVRLRTCMQTNVAALAPEARPHATAELNRWAR